MSPKAVITAILTVALSNGAVCLANACELLAMGLYNTSDTASFVEKAQAFRNQMCNKQYQDSGSASEDSAKLKVKLVDLGFSGNSSEWKKYESEVCDETTYNAKYKGKFQAHFQTVNSETVAALSACLNQAGLKVWLEPQADPKFVRLRAKFKKPSDDASYPKVSQLKITNATCDDTPASGTEIKESGWDIGCQRTGNAAVWATLQSNYPNLSEGGLQLSQIVVREPISPPAELRNNWAHHVAIHQLTPPAKAKLLSFVNEDCKPDEMADLQGAISQTSVGGNYNIHVFCRRGSGKLGNVGFEGVPYSNYLDTIQVRTAKGGISVIGFVHGGNTVMFHFFKSQS